ncbi:MAG: hypothetical protein C4288_18445 [Leptolyngbya sp. ERB_1_1]
MSLFVDIDQPTWLTRKKEPLSKLTKTQKIQLTESTRLEIESCMVDGKYLHLKLSNPLNDKTEWYVKSAGVIQLVQPTEETGFETDPPKKKSIAFMESVPSPEAGHDTDPPKEKDSRKAASKEKRGTDETVGEPDPPKKPGTDETGFETEPGKKKPIEHKAAVPPPEVGHDTGPPKKKGSRKAASRTKSGREVVEVGQETDPGKSETA